MTEKKKNPRRADFILDLLHLVCGLTVVVLAVLAFLSPEEHLLFFPLIFFLSALLSLVNGFVRLKRASRRKQGRYAGLGSVIGGALLLAVAAVSALVMR